MDVGYIVNETATQSQKAIKSGWQHTVWHHWLTDDYTSSSNSTESIKCIHLNWNDQKDLPLTPTSQNKNKKKTNIKIDILKIANLP